MKYHYMPEDETDLHERTEGCLCRPAITITRDADIHVTTTDVRHNSLVGAFLKTWDAHDAETFEKALITGVRDEVVRNRIRTRVLGMRGITQAMLDKHEKRLFVCINCEALEHQFCYNKNCTCCQGKGL